MIKKYLTNKNYTRTQKANINTIISLIFRAGSILFSFLLVPLTITYIKPDAYGIWITLSSLVGWIAMFDIGIANGLKNKLTETLADKNFEKGKMFVSTSYAIISLIAVAIILVYLLFSKYIKWQGVFNSNILSENELRSVVTIVVVLFLLKFITDIINVVSAAFQMVSVSSILLFLSNILIVISVWILSKYYEASLFVLSFILSFIPVIISIVASIFLYSTSFNQVSPKLSYVNFKESISILSLGSKFFILQIVVILIFQTDNILIAQFFNTSEVANFNVAYKYYSIVMVIFTVILTPYWTAFTDAYFKKDFSWIKLSIHKLIRFCILIFFFSLFMVFISSYVFEIWVGNAIKVPLSLSFSLCFYIAVMNWSSIFSNFLNGVGKIRLQIIIAPFIGVINILFSIIFVKHLNFGISSIPLANIFSLSIGAIIGYIQYNKIINNKAQGIWDK